MSVDILPLFFTGDQREMVMFFSIVVDILGKRVYYEHMNKYSNVHLLNVSLKRRKGDI